MEFLVSTKTDVTSHEGTQKVPLGAPFTPLASDIETFLWAMYEREGTRWWDARWVAWIPGDSRPSPITVGRWLGKHAGVEAGGLRLERRERKNWSAQYRVVVELL